MIQANSKFIDRCLLAAGFSGGTKQVETATAAVSAALGADGVVAVTVTGAYLAQSPRTISVPVAEGDSANTIAGKIRTALQADDVVSNQYVVSGTNAAIVLTDRASRANDSTLNVALASDITEYTDAGSSTNTTAGSVGTAQAITILHDRVKPGERRITLISRAPAGDHQVFVVEHDGTTRVATSFSALA